MLTGIHLFEGVFGPSHEDIMCGTQLEIEGIKAFENHYKKLENGKCTLKRHGKFVF